MFALKRDVQQNATASCEMQYFQHIARYRTFSSQCYSEVRNSLLARRYTRRNCVFRAQFRWCIMHTCDTR